MMIIMIDFFICWHNYRSLVGISNRSIEHHCDRNFEAAERVYLGVSSIADWVMQTIRR